MAFVLAACGGSNGNPIVDAAVPPDGDELADVPTPSDVGPQQAVAEIALSDCPNWHARDGGATCVARTPLTLTFVALTSVEADSYRWNVGDGAEPLDGPVVEHTYQVPGTYDVSLVVTGGFGTVQADEPALVTAQAAGVGGYCLRHANCASGYCMCGEQDRGMSDDCPPELSGTCSQLCDDQDCDQGLCADLRPGLDTVDPTETRPWRNSLCLEACQTDWDCARPGFTCMELPEYDFAGGNDAWIKVCFPALLSVVGGSCYDGTGNPDPQACVAGNCEPMGGLGYCTRGCTAGSCPSYALCAQMTGTQESICFPVCDAQYACDHDPLLACESADASGYYGFTLVDIPIPPSVTYCAPRRCIDDLDCGLSGRCDHNLGGFCTPL